MPEKEKDVTIEKGYVEKVKPELPVTWFDRGMHFLLTLMFTILLGVVVLQVLVRYGAVWTDVRVHWTGEVARYLLILTTFVGSAVAWRKRDNIAVSAIIDLVPKKVRFIVDIVQDTTILAFVIICIIGSYNMGTRMAGARLGSLTFIRLGQFYWLLGIAFVFIAIYLVRWIVKNIRDFVVYVREGSEDDE